MTEHLHKPQQASKAIFFFLCLLFIGNLVLGKGQLHVNYWQDSLAIEPSGKGRFFSNYSITFFRRPESAMHIVRMLSWFEKMPKAEFVIEGANGLEVARLRRKDLSYMQYVSSYSIYEDNDLYFIPLEQIKLPFTLRGNLELELASLVVLPRWSPFPDYGFTVGKSSFSITYPPKASVDYLLNPSFPIRKMGSDGFLRFEVDSLPGVKEEDCGDSRYNLLTLGRFKINQFLIDGMQASMASWEALGAWQRDLMKGLDSLPNHLAEKALALVKDYPDPKQRAAAIYRYLQSTKRYVSIQKGIGGWRPFPVTEVEAKGYGDCKALSLYTVAMMRKAGIPAECVLVKAGPGQPDIDIQFPSLQFNHMIACLPMGKDTVWLECTSQESPFGYLGPFTEGRHVLSLQANGGKLAWIPYSPAARNRLYQRAVLEFDTLKLAWNGVDTSQYEGGFVEEANIISTLSETEMAQAWVEWKNLNGLLVNDMQVSEQSGLHPMVSVICSLQVKEGLQSSSKRIIFKLSTLNPLDPPIIPSKERIGRFNIAANQMLEDEITFRLPPNAKIARLPELETTFESEFGIFQRSIVQKGNEISVHRKLTWKAGWFGPEKWSSYLDFLGKIKAADDSNVILERS